jgi:hypothetical protein
LKKLERLRAFFGFACESGWIAGNPAKKIKNPKVTDPPTMPFTQEEMVQILAACDKYTDNYRNLGGEHSRRIRAPVLLLRALGSVPRISSRYFFWSGKGKTETVGATGGGAYGSCLSWPASATN